MFWGYSLAFSSTASSFIGDLANFGMMNVGVQPSASTVIPTLVYALYQLFFATCTVQLVMGASFERGSILSSILFAFFWLTIVYCPVACWTWNAICSDLVEDWTLPKLGNTGWCDARSGIEFKQGAHA